MARLIDADALYEVVSEHVTTVSVCPTVDWARGKRQFQEIYLKDIQNAPTVDIWISVKDRLPEDEYECLICSGGSIEFGWFHGGLRQWVVEGCICGDGYVTHWMPLPELPKEDNDAEQ